MLQSNILIAGCGYVGEKLGTELRRLGHQVWGLRRNVSGLQPMIAPVRADLLQPSSLRALPPNLDFVFYTAAAADQSDGAYRAAYVDGLQNIMTALGEQGQSIRRFFFTSSTAVYAQSQGEWVDETSSTEPTHFSGLRLLEAENLVSKGPYPATVVRLAGIYGPGRAQTIASVRSGHARLTGGPPVYMNHIHRDDCAGALCHLMSLNHPESLYLGVDSAPADRREILAWLAERLGVSQPRLEDAPSPGGRRGAKRCSNARLVASGYQFNYPTYREGYGALIEAGY